MERRFHSSFFSCLWFCLARGEGGGGDLSVVVVVVREGGGKVNKYDRWRMACSVKFGYLCGNLVSGKFMLPCFHRGSLDHSDSFP